MDDTLRTSLERLHADGVAYDGTQSDRLRRRRNLAPAAAELLWFLVQALHATRVVEVGTSNGYSTIWLADAVAPAGGTVTSLDVEAGSHQQAAANLAAAGLAGRVDLQLADGGDYLAGLADGSVDLLFLDAERTEYDGWWPHPVRVLRPGGVLAIDNVLSHPDEVAPILARIDADPSLVSTVVNLGSGMLLATRSK